MPKFLIVDTDNDSRLLLASTVLRKFPQAVMLECMTLEAAEEIVHLHPLTGMIIHRGAGAVEGAVIVRKLRRHAPDTPIIMVSTSEQGEAAIRAGATRFLPYSEWLRVGTLMLELIPATDP